MASVTETAAAGPARKIIIDCDPGVDDALALAFAHGHPALHLVGITTVAGNVSLDKTTANALAVRDFAGFGDVPVTAGCSRPLLRPVLDARDVHGDSGLGNARLPRPRAAPQPGHAADYLAQAIAAAPGEITLIATGPLTNIAVTVTRYPELVRMVSDFVIMGGSAGRGNVTPAAEFNILADPEAAAIVFGAGWTVTMTGLDVTLQARADAAVRERMAALGRLGRELLLPCLSGYVAEPGGPAVHDVCAVALVAAPELFGCVPARVEVETAGRWTSGMTVTDFDAAAADRNARVATSIDVAAFWRAALDSYARVAAAMDARAEPGN
jgi:purine nucleosidase